MDPKAVVFFSSSVFDPASISAGMNQGFAGARVFGCTTAGEIISGKMLKNSLVAMALDAETVEDIDLQVVEDLKDPNSVYAAFTRFKDHFGVSMKDLDFQKYVGMILIDGLSGAEERTMEKIGDLTDVTFIGGSAGDDLQFSSTHVFADGKTYTNAAVLAVIRPSKGFGIIKTQSFVTLDNVLTPTKVDEANREILEFDGMPASRAYAEALGTTVEDAVNHFMRHPVGLVAGEEIYVRSPQQIQDGKIRFYCNVNEGMELSLLESTDIIEDTASALDGNVSSMEGVSALINFNCILRTLELEANGATDDYGRLFAEIPTIGFSTYGEEYIGHINQTATMLLLK
ncbi:FIST signal transduction protein [Methanofollis fontis]|nr:FIST N-terminal domain-containing protein [Methanofollis fontis]